MSEENKLNQSAQNRIKKFEEQIDLHIKNLNGIRLYIQMMCIIYKDNEAICAGQKQQFDQVNARCGSAIHKAKELVASVEQGNQPLELLDNFSFPPIKGLPDLDEMFNRSMIMVKIFEKSFADKQECSLDILSELEIQQYISDVMSEVS